jgi:hypothetical protein
MERSHLQHAVEPGKGLRPEAIHSYLYTTTSSGARKRLRVSMGTRGSGSVLESNVDGLSNVCQLWSSLSSRLLD